jgi:rhodanese-related sulfurtransferase
LLSFVILSCNGQTRKKKLFEVKLLPKNKNNQNPQILDVRTPEESNAGHLENA